MRMVSNIHVYNIDNIWSMRLIENAVILTWPSRTIDITNDTYIHIEQFSAATP